MQNRNMGHGGGHGGRGGHGGHHHRPPRRRMLGCCVYALGMVLLLSVIIGAILVII